MDQAFTYALPETLRHRVKAGSRILVPFGSRKLTGVILKTHSDQPQGASREAFQLLDEEPAIDAPMLRLGQWIATYYCAPLGEVLRSMTPLAGDIRRGKVYSLTPSGRDASRQLHLTEAQADAATQILAMLDGRPLSETYLKGKVA